MADDVQSAIEVEIERVAAAVRIQVGAEVADSVIRDVVCEEFLAYEAAPVRQFVPVLVQRIVVERLAARATST